MRSDTELVEAYRARGDRAALAELFRRHVDGAYRTALRILRHGPDAEDAVQTAFLGVLRHAASIRDGASFAGWLYRVVVNAALKLRAARPSPPPPVPAPRKEEVVRDDLHKALSELPEEYRLPLELHYFEGRSYEEIAQALDCPRGTVGTRLSRGIDRLRAAMAGSSAAITIGLLTAAGQEARAATAPAPLLDAVAAAARSAPVRAAGLSVLALAKAFLILALAGVSVTAVVRFARPGAPPVRSEARTPAPPSKPADPRVAAVPPEVEGRALRGRVLGPGGQPLEGARVWAVPRSPLDVPDPSILPYEVRPQTAPPELDPQVREILEALWKPVLTDAQGRYRLPLEEKDVVAEIRASHPTAAAASRGIVEGAAEQPDLRLPIGATVFGRISDTEGRPAEGVSIWLARDVGGVLGEASRVHLRDGLPVARTDAGGRFLVEKVPPGKLVVGAGGAGHSLGTVLVEVADGATSPELALRLKKGRTVTGVVLDPAGRPAANTGVFLHLGTGPVARESHIGKTDAEGRFAFDGIARGAGRVFVMTFRYANEEAKLAEDQTEVRILLQSAGGFKGRVVDARTGRPVDRFTASMAAEKGGFARPKEGRDGAFVLEPMAGLEGAGEYFVGVRAAGYATAWSGPHALKDGETTDVGVVALAPGVSLTGLCVDAKGRPVEGVRVAAVAPDTDFEGTPTPDEESAGLRAAFHPDRGRSGADGTFTVPDLAPGAYDLHAWHPAYPPHRVRGAASPVRLVLQPGGRLRGVVPKGKAKRTLEVASREGWDETVEPDGAGSWSYGPLAAGTYRLRLKESAGFLSDRTVAERDVVVTAGETAEWNGDGAAAPAVTAVGRVLTSDGAPAAGYHLLLGPDAEGIDDLRVGRTDEAGRFRIPDARPGRNVLFAAPSLDTEVDLYRRVDVDGSTPLEIRLPLQASTARGVVEAERLLRLRPAGEKVMTLVMATAKAGPEGAFAIRGLPAGRYDLYAAGSEVAKDRLILTFDLAERAELDLGRLR